MQGYIYDKKLVVKPGPAPGFYRLCPPKHRPRAVCTYLDDHRIADVYTYQYVEGRPATMMDVPSILEVASRELWRPVYNTGTTIRVMLPQLMKNTYVKHVLEVAHVEGPDDIHLLDEALKLILTAELPLVANVHGDLTFENVIIQEDDNVVFIDPGETYGAHTPALDRGKLLQSFVMRWEQRDALPVCHCIEWPIGAEKDCPKCGSTGKTAPWLEPNPFPAWADELDWAFLVTHWARLVRHWPEYDIMSGFKTLQQVRP